MAKLSDVIAKVDAALADGSAFQREPSKALELSRMRADAAQALAAAEEEWLEISGALEAAGA
jgi:ATP-binding cassette subfamily F protein 3